MTGTATTVEVVDPLSRPAARLAHGPLRVGLVGANFIGGLHLTHLSRMTDVRVTAVCDPDLHRAEAFGGACDAPAYQAFQELPLSELDALLVCLPPAERGALLEEAAGAGVHVFVEQPAARTMEDGVRARDAIRAAGVVAAVAAPWRTLRSVELFKRTVTGFRGKLEGRLMHASSNARFTPWLDAHGPLYEGAYQLLDMMRFAYGNVRSVSSSGVQLDLAAREERTRLELQFESGDVGIATVGWSDGPGEWALRASLIPNAFMVDVLHDEAGWDNGRPDLPPTFTPERDSDFSRSVSLHKFLNAVRNGSDLGVECTFADALNSLALAEAANEATHTRQAVMVQSEGVDRRVP